MLQNDEEIRSILILVQLMATISHSTAACERAFYAMNRKKTCLPTSLIDARLQGILGICINGVFHDEFDSESAIYRWLSVAKKCHLKRHKPTGPGGPQKNPSKEILNSASEDDVEVEILNKLVTLE